MIEPDQLLLLALAATGVTLLVSALVIAVRVRKVRELLLELDALRRSVQAIEGNLAETVQIASRMWNRLEPLSGLGLHLQQMKRDHLRLSENLRTISSAIDALRELVQLRDKVERGQDQEIREIADASRALQEWRSRVTAVYSEAGHLFESEPIRDLMDQFGARPAALTAEAQATARRTRRRSQKRVRPRRKT